MRCAARIEVKGLATRPVRSRGLRLRWGRRPGVVSQATTDFRPIYRAKPRGPASDLRVAATRHLPPAPAPPVGRGYRCNHEGAKQGRFGRATSAPAPVFAPGVPRILRELEGNSVSSVVRVHSSDRSAPAQLARRNVTYRAVAKCSIVDADRGPGAAQKEGAHTTDGTRHHNFTAGGYRGDRINAAMPGMGSIATFVLGFAFTWARPVFVLSDAEQKNRTCSTKRQYRQDMWLGA